jgi:DNA-binding NtrC family response regulator
MSTKRGTILVVDDEFSMRDSLTQWFREDGHEVVPAASGEEALVRLDEHVFDVALLDIKMPGMDGMELLDSIRRTHPDTRIIMITAFAAVDTAVRALKRGARDYVTKPVDPDELSHTVARAIEEAQAAREAAGAPGGREAALADPIVGKSPAIQKVRALIAQVARTDATVLIRGESGTGKELIARAIHGASKRRHFSLITVNSGALTESLLESELFGHEKGAFTGAQYRRKGKLEMADGGTLFLDEIATLTAKSQIDLLRVLETKEFNRLGGNQIVTVDFRVLCATNEDLEQLVRDRRFREDLFYRINVFCIEAPPLRDRKGDIPLIAEHCARRLAQKLGKPTSGLSAAVLERLAAHSWPGNVRELANVIERAMIVASGPHVEVGDLVLQPASGAAGTAGEGDGASPAASESLVEMEHQHIRRILEQTHWNISHAARVLKVDRATLYSKIKRYGLRR